MPIPTIKRWYKKIFEKNLKVRENSIEICKVLHTIRSIPRKLELVEPRSKQLILK